MHVQEFQVINLYMFAHLVYTIHLYYNYIRET